MSELGRVDSNGADLADMRLPARYPLSTMERSPDWLSICTDAVDMAAQDAAAFETHLLKSSNDVEARVKLIGFFQYGNAVHCAHIVLGKVAMARNEPASAAEHLRAASEVRGSPQLDSFGPDFELASQLLSIGQRDAVIDYIDGCKKFWKRC